MDYLPLWKTIYLIMSMLSLLVLAGYKWQTGMFPLTSFTLITGWVVGLMFLVAFTPTTFWRFAIVYAAGALLLRISTPILNRLEAAAVQQYRNSSITTSVRERRNDYVLFLRPFQLDDAMALLGVSAKWGGVDFETVLTFASKPVGDLVALGKPDDAYGAARLETSETRWFSTFVAMATQARLILVVPSARRGTVDETRWLVSESKLRRTIFVMPPLVSYRFLELGGDGTNKKSYAKQWGEAASIYKSFGLNMPSYTGDGALFMMDEQGNPRNVRSIGGSPLTARWMMRRYFRGVWLRNRKEARSHD